MTATSTAPHRTSRPNDPAEGIREAGGRELPVLDGIEHRFVDVAGLRVHVALAGQGEPLVLLHGWPQHWW
ncbi:alpha/beta fold hydrolase [Nocardia sp. NPDC020380]|uniref:alpha/beta fold hydrolase n=1 Tax=Nocardia sp. NPDC020380 TaxID=3364309 RepID=UPI0037A45211